VNSKIWGIGRKRYNEEISGAGLSPDRNLSVVKKIKANIRYWEAKVLMSATGALKMKGKPVWGVTTDMSRR